VFTETILLVGIIKLVLLFLAGRDQRPLERGGIEGETPV